MPTVTACPPAGVLEEFLLGRLAEEEQEQLAQHVLCCPGCVARMNTVRAEDALVESMRGGQPADPDGDSVTHLIRRLRDRAAAGQAPATVHHGGATGVPPEAQGVLAPPQADGEMGRLGGYRVLAVLGVGGMGVVFRAVDAQLERPVALKVLLPGVALRPANRERFLREAKAAAAVEHDHIVAILHVGEDRDTPFLVMPLLKGESLEDRLQRESPLPAAEAVRIGREIAEGLAAAHAAGLIHRDVKPANVWLEAPHGRVKLLDFGLARAAGDPSGLTHSGVIVGTPSYMAPEQSRAGALDARADLFSLGCVLYRMTTGRLPFTGADVLSVLASLAMDIPPAPRTLNPALPPDLSDLIVGLLAKDPANRPSSAGEVIEVLRALESRGMAALPALGDRTRRRRRWLWTAAAAVLLGVGTAAVLQSGLSFGGKSPTTAHVQPGADGIEVLERRAEDPSADRVALADDVRAWWRKRQGTAEGLHAAGLLRRLPSPLDDLDPRHLPEKRPELPDLVAVLRGHEGHAHAVAFSPDGRTVASGSIETDRTVRLWDLGGPAPRLRSMLGSRGDGVPMVAFSPDGGVLAAASLDGTVALWNLISAEPRPVLEPKKPGEQFTSVAWRADGRVLAAGTKSGSVYLWDLGRTPPVEEKRSASGGIIPAVTFAPQGEMLATGDKTVGLWGWPGADRPLALADEPWMEVRDLRFSPDGRLLAVGLATGAVRLWHLDGPDPVRGPLLKRHTNSVVSVAFSPDGRLLATAGDRRVVLWDASTREVLREWKVPGHCFGHIAFAPDSRHLVLGSDDDDLVLRLETPPR
jgi:hypothetical protein